MKHILLIFTILVGSVSATVAQAEDADFGIKELALLESGIGLSSIVMASDPKAWGTGFMVLSPLLAGAAMEGEFSWSKYLVGVAVIGGVGSWLASKENTPPPTLAKQMFLGYNAILIPVWLTSRNDKEKVSQNVSGISLRIDPSGRQVALGYMVKY